MIILWVGLYLLYTIYLLYILYTVYAVYVLWAISKLDTLFIPTGNDGWNVCLGGWCVFGSHLLDYICWDDRVCLVSRVQYEISYNAISIVNITTIFLYYWSCISSHVHCEWITPNYWIKPLRIWKFSCMIIFLFYGILYLLFSIESLCLLSYIMINVWCWYWYYCG